MKRDPVNRISQLRGMTTEINLLKEKLADLKHRSNELVSKRGQHIRSEGSISSTVEQRVIQIATLTGKIENYLVKMEAERNKLFDYIHNIPNSAIRAMCILYYFVDDKKKPLTWQQVANRMGNYYSSDYCGKTVARYIRKNPLEDQ